MSRPSSVPMLTRTAARLAGVTLLLAALLPPMLWLLAGAWMQHGRAEVAATAIAWQGLAGQGDEAQAERRRALVGSLGLQGPETRVQWRRAGERGGDVDLAVGEPPAWPTLSARATASDGTTVQVEQSLRSLLVAAAGIGLCSAALALVYWSVRLRGAVGLMARAESRMRSFASLDPLTGLLNRSGLRRRLKRSLDRATHRGTAVGMLLVDMDRFGLMNETLGQAFGDALLRVVADRMRAVTRAGDGLARLEGDLFAVHVDTLVGSPALSSMAANMLRALKDPFVLNGREVVASFSIGVASVEGGRPGVDGLLHQAATALRRAKREGGGRFCVHDAGTDADDGAQRLDLEQRLHGALGAGQFFVVYQPIVRAGDARVTCVEALLRWRDPTRGVVSPAEFVPVLEQTGLIVPVGRWVLREACRQAVHWAGLGPQGQLDVSVNLSPRQFAEPDLLATVDAVLRETGMPAERLHLEVTEGLLLDPTPLTLDKLDALAERGVRIAVDDFGMGYSSLMYLKRFRLHTLKIDRMFVRDIADRAQDRTIVRAIIDLGHGLGMRVTAEGVETALQSELLKQLGCDSLQGYLYGRPVPPAQLVQDLERADAASSVDADRPAPVPRSEAVVRDEAVAG